MSCPRAYYPLLLIAVGAVLFFTNLGATRLWDLDEAIFSETAREMHVRGDWGVPYYNGELFAHKPPLLYWCQMLAYQVWGPTEFAARLGSAILGIGTMLVVYDLGRILLGARAGLWAGLILGSCLNFTLIARAATPDSYLVFFCTLSLLVLVRGTMPCGERPPWRSVIWRRTFLGSARNPGAPGESVPCRATDETTTWRPALPPTWMTYALAYAVMGLAVLVKGPVGVVLPTAVWGLFLLFEQWFHVGHKVAGTLRVPSAGLPVINSYAVNTALNKDRGRHMECACYLRWLAAFHPWYVLRTIWSMRPLTAVAAVLLVAGPWYAWVGWRTDGEFLREFFGTHNFGRFNSAMENHRGPIYYYLLAMVAGTFPWCVLLAPSLVHLARSIRGQSPSRSGLVLLASWVAVWIGFFSLAGTKLPSYIVPAYPAAALLFAAG